MGVEKMPKHEDTNNERNIFQIVGFAVLGLCTLGIATAIVGAIAIIRTEDYLSGGVLFIASVLSFGLLLHAFVRK